MTDTCKQNISIEQQENCPTVINDTVCVKAKVTITPEVQKGEIKYFCMGNPLIGACNASTPPASECYFTVCQKICVQIPLTFAAKAVAEPDGIECGEAGIGECNGEAEGCTFTIGYYKNHKEERDALIAAAGGSIVLGVAGQGASFTVTAANAGNVLDFLTPSPPAPDSPPFDQQYQVLYAQLLAARLNVQGGATCKYITDAIAAANAFLASSPSGIGKEGAPDVQKPLATFNEGNAPGCPFHCPEVNQVASLSPNN